MANKKPPARTKKHTTKTQGGFTIVELLIATSVFSVVLLVVSTGIIRIGQSYYKGIIQGRTQEATRSIAEDISRALQLANGSKTAGAGSNQFCIGSVRYTYWLNEQVNSGTTGLKAENMQPDDACNDTSPSVGTNDRELLGNNMRLLKFDVYPVPTDPLSKTWKVDLRIAYGDNDLLTHYTNNGTPAGWNGSDVTSPAVSSASCKSGIPGGSFCATSQLDILVKKRLN